MSEPKVSASTKSKMERGMTTADEEKLYRRNGILFPAIMSPPENLDALKDMEAREDDVMLVAYPKCGCNWMVGVLRKIMTRCGHTFPEGAPIIEFHSPDTQKMLVVFRNPKDTVVSYYHFMNNNPVLPKAESWDKFFSDFMSGDVAWGSYYDHALSWEKRMDDPNVMIITYEELKENLREGVKKTADFFGFPLTDEQVQGIAEESGFKAMRSSSENSHGKFSSVFFRKGEVGDWRNHFSEAQSKQMDEEFQKKLAGTKLGAGLKYERYCL